MNIGIIVAAGSGERLFNQINIKKQYYRINNHQEMFLYPLKTFIKSNIFQKLILVIPSEDRAFVNNILSREKIEKRVTLVAGGNSRQESVVYAMDYLASIDELSMADATVFIHDADRPLVSIDLLQRLLQASLTKSAIIPIMPIFDSLLKCDTDEYVDRKNYFCIHTPQVFNYILLMKALSYAKKTNRTFGDEGSVIQYYGHKLAYVQSEIGNLKVTDIESLHFVEKWERVNG